jgi:rhodanese-related sulfurtransferase
VDEVRQAFGAETSNDEFKAKYGVDKPKLDAYIIMSCRTGRRSQMALDILAELGYTK